MKRSLLLAVAIASAALGPATAATAYKAMSAEDFFLDRRSLIDQSVEVQAQFQASGDTVFMLLHGETRSAITNATFVNVDAVARDDRKSLYARCQELCEATVRGTVKIVPGPIGSDIGIVAQSFTLTP